MTSPNIDLLVERALHDRKGKARGDETDFLCIAHEERNPSAGWNRKAGVWHCMSCGEGGSTADLAQRLGIKIEKRDSGKIVATYDYRDEAGRLLYQAVRYQPKDFRQRRPDGAGGWIWNLKDTRLVLYRLPELVASRGRVYIPEGEKDVDALRARGLTAICNAMGASEVGKSKWYPDLYNDSLRGREVVIIPDRDKAGDNHGAFVAQSVTGTASTVKVLVLPGLEWKIKGGPDVSDWFSKGGTLEELEELADACPIWSTAGAGTNHEFPETDSGNAEMFAHMYGDRARYDWKRERWLVWDRHRWVPDATGELIRLAIKVARERARQAADLTGEKATRAFGFAKASESAGKIDSMIRIARALPPIADAGEGWDANPLLMGFENGVVNLTTGILRPGRQEDRITKTTNISYDPEATCPRWERCLVEVLPDDQVRAFVRLAMGYSITGITREQVFFILWGRGANGKGTIIDTLRNTVGGYGDIMAFATIEKGKDQSIPSDMAALAGRRIITTSETDKATRFNEARIKSLTGEDPIKGRELYHSEFTFQPELKMWVAVNDKPQMRDDSHGMWRRVRLIPFVATFDEASRDNNLRETLKAEAQGIAAWLVRAAVEWHKKGLPIPPAVAVATMEYRDESDPLSLFIADRCVLGDHAMTGATPLYKAYHGWAEAQSFNQRETLSATMFGRLMGDRFTKRAFKGVREYLGIGLISDGWEGKPSTQVEGSESPTSFLPTSTSALSREHVELRKNPLEPSKPSTQVTDCDCEVQHPGQEDCADETWTEDGAHCLRHCQRNWVLGPDDSISEGD